MLVQVGPVARSVTLPASFQRKLESHFTFARLVQLLIAGLMLFLHEARLAARAPRLRRGLLPKDAAEGGGFTA